MPKPKTLPKVALLFETTNAYARELLIGIGDYILSHGPWSVHFAELGRADPPPSSAAHGPIVRARRRTRET